MKCIVEFLNELREMDDVTFARRFGLPTFANTYSRRLDFENWLRQCVEPARQFGGMDDAWGIYEHSFG